MYRTFQYLKTNPLEEPNPIRKMQFTQRSNQQPTNALGLIEMKKDLNYHQETQSRTILKYQVVGLLVLDLVK